MKTLTGPLNCFCAEVQQHVPAAPSLGDIEAAAIGHAVDMPHHTGQSRFDGKRHKDLGRRVVGKPDIPQAIRVKPFLTDHLRLRILGQGFLRRDLLGPARQQRTGGRLPLGGLGGRQRRQGEQNGNDRRQALHGRLLEKAKPNHLAMEPEKENRPGFLSLATRVRRSYDRR